MRPVSDALLRTVRGAHMMAARARVVETFQTGVNPTGTEIKILGGDTAHDSRAQIRSTLDLETDGTGMWPSKDNLLLAPYGNEVFVERGIKYGNGTTEWVSLGYYQILRPEQDQPEDGPIRLAGRDRMGRIVEERLIDPVQFDATETYGSVVEQLVTDVYPDAVIEWDSGDGAFIGRSLICADDRYKFLAELIDGLGKIWYWDHRGILVIRDLPDTNNPVFDVDAGPNGVLIGAARQLTRERVYNAVIAIGEGVDTAEPVRAVAYDDNPASPTYFGGQFGKIPEWIRSPSITSIGQAYNAAAARLRKQLGLRYSADFSAVPNPALEPWDPVRVRYSGKSGLETHVLDWLVIPLTAKAPMAARTREQSIVIIGGLS